jgi:hypothetical protein
MSEGLPQAAVILGATVIFASFAWSAGMVRPVETKCAESVQVVEYLPLPALEPIIPTPPLGWPVLDRQRADDTPPAAQPVAEKDVADSEPRRRHRWRRHYWRRR